MLKRTVLNVHRPFYKLREHRNQSGLLLADVSVVLSSVDDWEHLLAVASVLDVVTVEPVPEYGC